MLGPRPGRILAILLALLIAAPAAVSGQVWKPRSQSRTEKVKKTRKAPRTKVKRGKKKISAEKKIKSKRKRKQAKRTPRKGKRAPKRRAPRDDDDFTITVENYPDED